MNITANMLIKYIIVTTTAFVDITNAGTESALISFISTRNISLLNIIPNTIPAVNDIIVIITFSKSIIRDICFFSIPRILYKPISFVLLFIRKLFV